MLIMHPCSAHLKDVFTQAQKLFRRGEAQAAVQVQLEVNVDATQNPSICPTYRCRRAEIQQSKLK